ncbi:hypothetical protein JTB14_036187 [Gonioctena quinquepunctata]|nr:hypothetical protein JTB14_036187 [Gonioctena quinquepunctata]
MKTTTSSDAPRSLKSTVTRSIILPTTADDFVEHYVVVPPDGGWGWLIVFITFVCNFLVDGTIYTFGIFLDELAVSFDVLPTDVALVNSLMSGFYYIVGPFACALSNKFGFRLVGILGALMAAASFFVSSYLTSFIAFLVAIGVFAGIGFNMVYTPCILIVGYYFERWRALATAISVTGSSLGVTAFPQIFERVLSEYNWRFKFQLLSGTCVVLTLLIITFKPIKHTKVIEEKKVTFSRIPSIAEEDSIGSFHLEREDQGLSFKQLFHKLKNTIFPTVIAYTEDEKAPGGKEEASTFMAMLPDTLSEESYTKSVFRSQRGSIAARSAMTTTAREQDVYEEQEQEQETCCTKCCHKLYHDRHVNRPMYRDDIFYGGSVYHLPEYMKAKSKSKATIGAPSAKMSYLMSVSRVITQKDIEETRKCVCCPEAFIRVLITMMDVRLFKSLPFVLLTMSGFLSMVGLYIPFVFITHRGLEIGLDADWCNLLLTILGAANGVGRICCGVISFFPSINPLVVSYVTLIIAGLFGMCSALMSNWAGQLIFVIIYGLCVGEMKTFYLRTLHKNA